MKGEILEFLKMNDVEYKENASLAAISTVKIGANADLIVYPNNIDKLVSLVSFFRKSKIRHKILGRMSNVLPPDENYCGVIVRTNRFCDYKIKGNLISASAGAFLPYLAKKTADAGLSGLEELSGIPGSLGGAVAGNAGAFGREISDLVESVRVFDVNSGVISDLKSNELGFKYRTSIFKSQELIILSASLRTCYSDKICIFSKISEYAKRRRGTQPVGFPSLGSTFKRPGDGIYAAKMIDECGLKGYKIGGASISERHAGFIVNVGGATASDYLSLADYATECVYRKFGINLEKEIEIL